MYWLDLLFPPAMILFPGLMCALWQRPADAKVDAARVRKLTLWLWLGTGIALGAFAAVWWQWGGPAARHMWVLCWFLFPVSMLLLGAKNPDLTTHNSDAMTRTASLLSRRRAGPIPWFAWVVAWGVWLAGAAVVLWRCLQPDADTTAARWGLVSGLIGLAAFCPALTMWCVRLLREEPEPRDAAGSAEVAAAYNRLRSFRAWTLYGLLGILMPLMLAGFAALMVWLPAGAGTGALLGIAGGVIGTALGVVGAVAGTLASVHRARINGLLRRLESGG
jgi:hypothetical protein